MKLLVATDLHYIPDLAQEIAANQARLPTDTYKHQIDGKLYWHNQLMVEAGEQLLDGLERIARQEAPDLFLFLGDMVNVNWRDSIQGVAARLKHFPCPVRQVLGNHDIYLGGAENRLQDAVTPGTYASGICHEIVHKQNGEGKDVELGLIYLDLFVRSAPPDRDNGTNDSGTGDSEPGYRKWTYPPVPSAAPPAPSSEAKEYRPQDITAALDLMASAPDTPWLIAGHYPFVVVNPRIVAPGRKLMGDWPSAAPLAALLADGSRQPRNLPNNLLGILCGHQHFAHFQRFANGFHWHLPALVEYPCAAVILEWDGATLQGRTVPVDEELAAASLQARQERWPEGEAQDRYFIWRAGE